MPPILGYPQTTFLQNRGVPSFSLTTYGHYCNAIWYHYFTVNVVCFFPGKSDENESDDQDPIADKKE